MSEIMGAVKMLVESNGDIIKNGEQECKVWYLTHENCFGCSYELGCSKQVRIGLTIFASNEYNSDRIQGILDKLIAAKTVEELKGIQIPESISTVNDFV